MDDERAQQRKFPVQAHNTQPFNSMNFDELLVKNMMAIHGHGSGQMVPEPPSSSSSFFFENLVSVNKKHEEATLEHFLVRTGLLNMGDHRNGALDHPQPLIAPASQQHPNQLQLQMGVQHQQQGITAMNSAVGVYENPAADVGYPENHLAAVVGPAMSSATSSDCVRKRRSSNMLEKSIERRQKRMIKNRESAARSRARKQAYTHQLEQEVDQLKKMNSWLKKQQDLEMMMFSNTNDEPKYQLRRTSSAPF